MVGELFLDGGCGARRRKIARNRKNIIVAYVVSFKLGAVLCHRHQRFGLEKGGFEKHIILVVFLHRYHAAGNYVLNLLVEGGVFSRLDFFQQRVGGFLRKVNDLYRFLLHDVHKSHFFPIGEAVYDVLLL